MLFQFAPAVEAAIEAGKYAQVFTSAGVPIAMARDAATGRFVAHAIGAVAQNSPISPLISPVQMVMGTAQMYQMHQGFSSIQAGLQTIQSSLGVLQATTAFIGLGTVAVGALSAVNLHQTLKLRKEVEQLRLEVKEGFIDLKQALKNQGTEIRELIEQVAADIEFRNHRTILVRAYGLFTQALHRFRSAMQIQDAQRRNAEIDGARGMLFQALADYDNRELLSATCSAGQLRRLECAWAIEQAIIATYQVQKESVAVSDRLSHLQAKIRQDALDVVDCCETQDELDFLFPELTRIHAHDLAVLESWQNQVDWVRELPPSELKLLESADFKNSEFTANPELAADSIPDEQLRYETLQQKSHFYSLRDQLALMIEPELREDWESYVSQQAAQSGYKTLVSSNLQQASDLTVANLYWYFKVRDESEKESEDASDADEGLIEETPEIYRNLRNLLAAKKWKEADEETAAVMFKLSGQKYEISSSYGESVSYKNFQFIDNLWLRSSNGQFGFSVQKRIWLELSAQVGSDSDEIYTKFCERVGWRVKSGCLLSSYLTFTLDAPKGHLPVQVAGQGWSAVSFLSSLASKNI
jgi:hypothetical protein